MRSIAQRKRVCTRWKTTGRSGLLWYWKTWEDQVALLGRDPAPYSLAKMRPTIEAFIGHAVAQGLLEKPMPADALFANF